MKSFADWTQDVAASNQEPPPDDTDTAGDGLGFASAHYGYVTCPHCGYDFIAAEYPKHILDKHGDL